MHKSLGSYRGGGVGEGRSGVGFLVSDVSVSGGGACVKADSLSLRPAGISNERGPVSRRGCVDAAVYTLLPSQPAHSTPIGVLSGASCDGWQLGGITCQH
jgi:hypothetical protein